ncbi:MAG: apolipoprotein N-acyltransferase [archaeon]
MKKKLIALLSSILLFIPAIPGFDYYFFAFIAFVPFFIVVLYSKKIYCFSLIFGLMFGGLLYGFILFTHNSSFYNNLAIYCVLVLMQGLIFIVFAFIISKNKQIISNTYVLYAVISISWAIIEYLFNYFYHGFAIYIGFTQYNNSILLFLASYIGLFGVSAVIIFINIVIADIYNYFRKNEFQGNINMYFKKFIPLIFIVLVGFIFNIHYNISYSYETNKEINFKKYSLIQANIDSYQYARASGANVLMEDIFTEYYELTKQTVKSEDPDIILWPETAVHRWVFRLKNFRNQLKSFANENDVELIIGAPDLDGKGKEFNSVFSLSSEGEIVDKYDKNILVPIWEENFSPGRKIVPIKVNDKKAGVNICFEILFPFIFTEQINRGAEVLFVHSNNGMFGFSTAPYIYSAFSVFRAVENNVYLFQVMNTGVSMVVSPKGEIIEETKIFDRESLSVSVEHGNREKTFFSKYGFYLYLIITFGFSLYFIFVLYSIYIKDI